jgi:hypothetical protein
MTEDAQRAGDDAAVHSVDARDPGVRWPPLVGT